jgi:hypothetical protein
MEAPCGHLVSGDGPEVCIDILVPGGPQPAYLKCYPRVGLDHVLLCVPCADELADGRPPRTFALCEDCLWDALDGDFLGMRVADVVERPEGLGMDVSRHALPAALAPMVDLAYAPGSGAWYGLRGDGVVHRLGGDWSGAGVAAEAGDDHGPAARLAVAMTGRFVAVTDEHGRRGLVVDAASAAVTIRLDPGGDHEESAPCSVAFARLGEREVLVHRTAWNRLEVSDPATGERLAGGEPIPEHHRDYGHGRLHVSPGGGRLLDDGWVAHPYGLPVTWSLAEGGPSWCMLDRRESYWDHGMCWIDDQRVAIEGIGLADDHMVAGARVFDVTRRSRESTPRWPAAVELTQFPGPTGDFFSDGVRLFSSAADGLSVWSLADGARIAHLEGFRPRHHSRATGQLVELGADELAVWSYPPP